MTEEIKRCQMEDIQNEEGCGHQAIANWESMGLYLCVRCMRVVLVGDPEADVELFRDPPTPEMELLQVLDEHQGTTEELCAKVSMDYGTTERTLRVLEGIMMVTQNHRGVWCSTSQPPARDRDVDSGSDDDPHVMFVLREVQGRESLKMELYVPDSVEEDSDLYREARGLFDRYTDQAEED